MEMLMPLQPRRSRLAMFCEGRSKPRFIPLQMEEDSIASPASVKVAHFTELSYSWAPTAHLNLAGGFHGAEKQTTASKHLIAAALSLGYREASPW